MMTPGRPLEEESKRGSDGGAPEAASVLIGVGSNLGDRHDNIRRGIELLGSGDGVEVVAVSTWLETQPVGGPPQGSYINGALEIRSSLGPRRLLDRLQTIERELGRVRDLPNGPRTLDLDILLHGEAVLDEPDLVIPHPRMLERAFVLDALVEIAPDRIHPVSGRSVRDHWASWHGEMPKPSTEGTASRPETERRSGALRVVETAAELATWSERFRAAGLSVGLVPTMGALHEGHVSLIRRARLECDRVAVSIFVNPTQFGPSEDLDGYPRTQQEDLDACRSAGVDLVLLGAPDDMFPSGFQTWVTVERLSRPLCGRTRPGHFRGVATVVAQLLQIARPHRAYFGTKDYQQSRVIGRMIADLHIDTELRCCETVREADGLAMSSRNAYLDPESRALAPRLFRALSKARDLVVGGERRVAPIRAALEGGFSDEHRMELEYAEVLDAETLEELTDGSFESAKSGVLLALAVRVGPARLIDNTVIPAEDL